MANLKTITHDSTSNRFGIRIDSVLSILTSRWETQLIAERDENEIGEGLDTISFYDEAQLNITGSKETSVILPNVPARIWTNIGDSLSKKVAVVTFECKVCGASGTMNKFQHKDSTGGFCPCTAKKEDWNTKLEWYTPDQFMGWWLLQPATHGRGTRLDALQTMARPSKRRTKEVAAQSATALLVRMLRDCIGQLAYPEGAGASYIREQGTEPGRIRIVCDIAPWYSGGNLHIAEASIATRLHVAKMLRSKHKSVSIAATSSSKPGLVFFKSGKHGVPLVIEEAYPGWRYNKPGRFNTMHSSLLNAIVPNGTGTQIVKVKGGVKTPGHDLLTVWMDDPRTDCDVIVFDQKALDKFEYVQSEKIQLPKGSNLFVVDGQEIGHHSFPIAQLPSGKTKYYNGLEFEIVSHYIKVEGSHDHGFTITVNTPRVPGEASKFTCNGAKGSALPDKSGYYALINGDKHQIGVVSGNDRMNKQSCWAPAYEALASQIAKIEGLEQIEVEFDETWEMLQKRLAEDIILDGTNEDLLQGAGDFLSLVPEDHEDGATTIGRYPIFKDNGVFVGMYHCGWNRWMIQPQSPEVQSALSDRKMPKGQIRSDEQLERVVNKSSQGSKALGWELAILKILSPKIHASIMQHQNDGTATLIECIKECLTFKSHYKQIKEIGYEGQISLLTVDEFEDSED